MTTTFLTLFLCPLDGVVPKFSTGIAVVVGEKDKTVLVLCLSVAKWFIYDTNITLYATFFSLTFHIPNKSSYKNACLLS